MFVWGQIYNFLNASRPEMNDLMQSDTHINMRLILINGDVCLALLLLVLLSKYQKKVKTQGKSINYFNICARISPGT